MRALLAKSQFVEIQRFTAFSSRFFNEGVKPPPRALVVDDFFPTLVTLCKLAQLIKHGPTLSFAQLGKFLDDFRCAHVENYSVGRQFVRRAIRNFLR